MLEARLYGSHGETSNSFVTSRLIGYITRMTDELLPHGLSGRDEQRAYFDWITGLFGEALAGDVLDHGAGTGMLTERLRTRASRVVALEPEQVLFDQLCERFAGAPNVTPVLGTIETYLERFGAGQLDAIA